MPSLTGLIAKRFIAEPRYYAVQSKTGAWRPSYAWNEAEQKYNGPVQPFTPKILQAHLNGDRSIGHYMVNRNGDTKLFAFDLDLRNDTSETTPWIRYPSAQDIDEIERKFADDDARKNAAWEHLMKLGRQQGNPRALWADKKHVSRPYLMRQMRGLAEMLSQRIQKELGIPVACAYSGSKGLHVYGFTGMIPAPDARTLALQILDSFERFEPLKGKNFYGDTDLDPETGFPTLEIEVFPKQETVREDGFGNLLALPLGRNMKAPKNIKFFLDQRAPHSTIVPHTDPLQLLTEGDPWK